MRASGHSAIAAGLEETLIGRTVIDGRWTFQIVEKYDTNFSSVFVDVQRAARREPYQ